MVKKGITIVAVVVIFLIAFLFLCPYFNKPSIQQVLKSDAYTYLSNEAKEYIEEIYEETGDIVLTEKNKEENVPYLNPSYIEYLSLSDEEKSLVSEIPNVYTVDFSVDKANGDLPASYDLRNVGGKNYVTPLKEQNNLNLCWSFTSIEQAESYFLVKNKQNYSSSFKLYSVRQLDYASSDDGIIDYNNEDGVRELASGGNFLNASSVMINGLGMVYDSKVPLTYDYSQKELSDILNYSNSQYELNASVMFPRITSDTSASEKNDIISAIKEYVMNYGGAYVGTQAPGYSCSSSNNGSVIIRVDDGCVENAGHALQIIGWDDQYSYSYCKTGDGHSNNVSSCSSSNLVQGTGAWLLRNSWGSFYSYVYLAYDSLEDDIYVMSDFSSMASRNWDNNYHSPYDPYYVYLSPTDTRIFKKKITGDEKVEKIKFFSYGKGGTYNISVVSGMDTYKNIKTVTVPYPGYYTVDLSDLNIIARDDSIKVTISSTNRVSLMQKSMAVFTSNVSDTKVIKADENDIHFDEGNSNYSFRSYSYLKNIPSNKRIKYTLLNGVNDYSQYLTVSNNIVSKNDVNSLITISSSIPSGVYTLRAYYNNISDGITDDITVSIGDLTHWNIYYYANNGTNNSSTQTVDANTSFTLNGNTFTRTGYLFKEWNTKSDGSGDRYQDAQTVNGINNHLYLYAVWNPITYSVSYDANGGVGSIDSQSFVYDTAQALVANTFTKEGYRFVSWNTKADGSGKIYADQAVVTNLTSVNNKEIKLYAQWAEDVPYVIQNYAVDEDNHIIDSIGDETNLLNYKRNFILDSGYSIEVELGDNNYIYTGSITKIYHNDELVAQYTNVVRGDINCDGKITALDYIKIRNHIMGTNIITGDILTRAADANMDNQISSLDYIRIRNIIMNRG